MTEAEIALYLVLIGFVVVLISDLIGNFISFENRVINALVTATVFTGIFGMIVWRLSTLEEVQRANLNETHALSAVGIGFVAVFISDFIGNNIAFGSKFVNAMVTATVFALMFGGSIYYLIHQ